MIVTDAASIFFSLTWLVAATCLTVAVTSTGEADRNEHLGESVSHRLMRREAGRARGARKRHLDSKLYVIESAGIGIERRQDHGRDILRSVRPHAEDAQNHRGLDRGMLHGHERQGAFVEELSQKQLLEQPQDYGGQIINPQLLGFVKTATQSSDMKLVQGVGFYGYNKPYRNQRSTELPANATDWMVMLKPECTETLQQDLCMSIPDKISCLTKGHAGTGIGFVLIRSTEAALQAMLATLHPAAHACVRLVEPDAELRVAPEEFVRAEQSWRPAREQTKLLLAGKPHLQADMQLQKQEPLDATHGVRLRTMGGSPRAVIDKLPREAGSGVHVYIADTGIRQTHRSFRNASGSITSRVKLSADATRVPLVECSARDVDCAIDHQGHGTHAAGTVGGLKFGLAPGATLHALKVLNDQGIGSHSALVEALDWVISRGERPAVFSVGIAAPGVSHALAIAIETAAAHGITVVVAAGNHGEDACGYVPAYVPQAITVGAADNDFKRARFSNHGMCVDFFASGVELESPGFSSDVSSLMQSSTSAACNVVAGAAALILWQNHEADVKERLFDATMLSVGVSDGYAGADRILDVAALAKEAREMMRTSTEVCENGRSLCDEWARNGECTKNPTFMLPTCQLSCATNCAACTDQSTSCPAWASEGYCTSTNSTQKDDMESICKLSCCQAAAAFLATLTTAAPPTTTAATTTSTTVSPTPEPESSWFSPTPAAAPTPANATNATADNSATVVNTTQAAVVASTVIATTSTTTSVNASLTVAAANNAAVSSIAVTSTVQAATTTSAATTTEAAKKKDDNTTVTVLICVGVIGLFVVIAVAVGLFIRSRRRRG